MKRREFMAASGALLGSACVPDVLATNSTAEYDPVQTDSWMKEATAKLEAELVTKHGASQRERIQRGLKQVADFWRKEDGPKLFRPRKGTKSTKKATGAPVGPEALLHATEKALRELN